LGAAGVGGGAVGAGGAEGAGGAAACHIVHDKYSSKTQSVHFQDQTLRLAIENARGKSTAPWVLQARGEEPSVQEGREAQAVRQPATVSR